MKKELIVVAKFIAKNGQSEKLHEALYSLLEPTRQESSCLSYELHQHLDNPKIFTMIEKFKDKTAGEFHVNQSYLVEFKKKASELIESAMVDCYRIADIPDSYKE